MGPLTDPQITMGENETQGGNLAVDVSPESPKAAAKKDASILTHEPGKSLLPFSRVQKIMKADKDIPVVTKEAVFLISLATEEFIKRIAEAAQSVAAREKRMIVQHKDLATVVRKVDEFAFLEELIPWMSAELTARRKPKADKNVQEDVPSMTLLDQFIAGSSTKSQLDAEVVSSENQIVNKPENQAPTPGTRRSLPNCTGGHPETVGRAS